MRDIQGTADDLRAAASNLGKRASSFALYDILGGCMQLAERLNSDDQARETMLMRFRLQNTGGNRRFIMARTDSYMLVCRYVFHDEDDKGKRNAAWRYGVALSVAAQMGVSGKDMAQTLKDRGGINTFFQRRKQPRELVRAKTLRLTRQIEIPSNKPFTLTLRRLPDNIFEVDVVSVEEGAA